MLFRKGHLIQNTGRTRFKKGNHPVTEFKKGQIPWNKGTRKKYYCQDCKKPLIDSRSLRCHGCTNKERYRLNPKRGAEIYNYKGITPLVKQIRNCFQYRQWRSDVYTRDDFTCQICDERGYRLHAHHCLKSFAEIIERYEIVTFKQALECAELWNINNGITLCLGCHKKLHKGEKSWTSASNKIF